MLSLAESVRDKVDHALDRIHAVKGSCRQFEDTAAALDALADKLAGFKPQLNELVQESRDATASANFCDVVLDELFRLLPHIGFLHRSRNASNPFELHGPLKRLARKFVDSDVRLIISNEWELSPFTHPSMLGIEGFVLLGLPASEAADNGLLAPVAGHELGHSVWKRRRCAASLREGLEREIFDLMRSRIADVEREYGLTEEGLKSERGESIHLELLERAEGHCEELFCDLCGLILFGESYCHAFAHLLAPGLPARQDVSYPSPVERAEYLKEAGRSLNIPVPGELAEMFTLQGADDLAMQIVKGAVDQLFDKLCEMAMEHAKDKEVDSPTADGVKLARMQLAGGVPVQFTSTLPEILCAAWELRLDPDLWKSTIQWREVKNAMLNELVLKSAEALEYWNRVEGGADA